MPSQSSIDELLLNSMEVFEIYFLSWGNFSNSGRYWNNLIELDIRTTAIDEIDIKNEDIIGETVNPRP